MHTKYVILNTKYPQKGFTLLEVILAMGISTILILGLASLDRILSDSQTILSISSQAFNEANIGIDAMVREIRNARPADNGAYPLEIVDNNEIAFYANIDDDNDVERIRYYLNGDELSRGVTQPTGSPVQYLPGNEEVNLVINNVQNTASPIFFYYNGDWPADTVNNPLANPVRLSDTKLIQVELVINPRPSRPEAEFTINSYAQIRNLKTNL